jgi:hypothetical protein
VHYPGHDYQPHINHVGQTDRARHLHNLPPLPPESPDYEAFRFGAEKHAPLFFECHCVCLEPVLAIQSVRFFRWGDVLEAGAGRCACRPSDGRPDLRTAHHTGPKPEHKRNHPKRCGSDLLLLPCMRLYRMITAVRADDSFKRNSVALRAGCKTSFIVST